jgi:HK97 gp10 family phage protein
LGEKTDEIVPRVLQAGAEVVEAKVRSSLQSAIGSNTQEESRSTGELLSALGSSPVKVNRDGDFDTKIGFREPRSDGGSNALVANILEHGRSNQPARPFLKPAVSASKKDAIAAMTQKMDEEIAKL